MHDRAGLIAYQQQQQQAVDSTASWQHHRLRHCASTVILAVVLVAGQLLSPYNCTVWAAPALLIQASAVRAA